AADDLKARDALLRGFPEVESVIGKAGRADTPTDPAPLDMVETFVNFRPRELWPKRVLKFDDALKQADAALLLLEQRGYVVAPKDKSDGDALLNDATQKSLERFDETLRELALLRYREIETDLDSRLTEYAISEIVRRLDAANQLHWPPGTDQATEVTTLAKKFTPEYGRWLARNPAFEDVSQLAKQVAEALHATGAV